MPERGRRDRGIEAKREGEGGACMREEAIMAAKPPPPPTSFLDARDYF